MKYDTNLKFQGEGGDITTFLLLGKGDKTVIFKHISADLKSQLLWCVSSGQMVIMEAASRQEVDVDGNDAENGFFFLNLKM